ncbi:hypothetical protein [Lysobacter enzymogenes]|uniref:DUF4142 domain-containing protein n=1 Tax=Lysobacter enzymogenes TaxID=69 RepID=A0A3N2RC86_LYSEN|nr:hypothetical protein [Lysobacter enzymogenes]ROU05079.1 hypothetical protein D9T17_20625 [Lysobacter enzymogenes]
MQSSIATSAAVRVVPRRRVGVLAAAARTLALTMVLLFSAGAQADPAKAEQIMQVVGNQRSVLDTHMFYVNLHLDSGNVTEAQYSLLLAHSEAVSLGYQLAQLGNELRDSRAQGQYNDLQALERAIQHGDVARNRMRMIQSYLMTLQMERPPSAITRMLLDSQFQSFNLSMQQLRQAMDQA